MPDDEEGFASLCELALGQGRQIHLPDGRSWILWRDPSGASLSVYTSVADEIVCATPSFAGSSTVPLRLRVFTRDPECDFCSVLEVEVVDEEGEMLHPMAVQVEEVGELLSKGLSAQVTDGSLTAFAEQIDTWEDESAYEASQASKELQLATESLIPVGLFGEQPRRRRITLRRKVARPEAQVLMTGRVQEAGIRTNEGTGLRFAWAQVITFGGTYDVVADPDELTAPLRAGSVIQGIFWVVGRLGIHTSAR